MINSICAAFFFTCRASPAPTAWSSHGRSKTCEGVGPVVGEVRMVMDLMAQLVQVTHVAVDPLGLQLPRRRVQRCSHDTP